MASARPLRKTVHDQLKDFCETSESQYNWDLEQYKRQQASTQRVQVRASHFAAKIHLLDKWYSSPSATLRQTTCFHVTFVHPASKNLTQVRENFSVRWIGRQSCRSILLIYVPTWLSAGSRKSEAARIITFIRFLCSTPLSTLHYGMQSRTRSRSTLKAVFLKKKLFKLRMSMIKQACCGERNKRRRSDRAGTHQKAI